MAGGVVASATLPLNVERELELTIQDLRDNLPGFDKYAEILVACYFRGDWPLIHRPTSFQLPQKTPVENLYNVGDGVSPPDSEGIRGCAESARLVVEDVKKRFQPSCHMQSTRNSGYNVELNLD